MKHTTPENNSVADLIFSWIEERRTEDLYDLEEIHQEQLHNNLDFHYKPWDFLGEN